MGNRRDRVKDPNLTYARRGADKTPVPKATWGKSAIANGVPKAYWGISNKPVIPMKTPPMKTPPITTPPVTTTDVYVFGYDDTGLPITEAVPKTRTQRLRLYLMRHWPWLAHRLGLTRIRIYIGVRPIECNEKPNVFNADEKKPNG